MSVTATVEAVAVPGASIRKKFLLALDNSYPNPAGYVLTPATFGLSTLKEVTFSGAASLPAGLYEPVLIPTYATDGSGNILSIALHLIIGTTGAEVANAVDVHTSTLAFAVEGN
jgi:hypothetical protein